MTLPSLSTERLEQMIHLATSHKQVTDPLALSWYRRVYNKLHLTTKKMVYGLSATALSFSCVAGFWLMPMVQHQTEIAPTDISMSEYIMQDLLEDLSQSSFQT